MDRSRTGVRIEWRSPNFWLVIGVAASAVALQAAGLDTVLRFDREGIARGAWWLLITANLVHLGWSHVWLNLAGLGLIALLLGDRYPWWQWLLVGVASGLAVTLGLWCCSPEWRWYVGLSGALHGLFVAGAIGLLRGERNFALALLAGVAVKLAYEQAVGPSPGTAELAGGPVVVDAHLFGALGGAVAAALLWPLHGRKR